MRFSRLFPALGIALLPAWAAGPLEPMSGPLQVHGALLAYAAVPVFLGLLLVVLIRLTQRMRQKGRGEPFYVHYYTGPMVWALLTMGVGLVASVALAERGLRDGADQTQQRFNQQVLLVEERIRDSVQGLVRPLNGLRGAFQASDYVSHSEFAQYVTASQMTTDYPGVRGFGYVERAARQDLERLQARQRSEGAAGFTLQTRGAAPDALVVKYVQPLQSNRAVVGLDVGGQPQWRAAAERAMKAGQATFARPSLHDLQTGQSHGLLLFLPHYGPGPLPAGEPERVRRLVGWTFADVVFSELLNRGEALDEPWVEFQLFSADSLANQTLMYDSLLPGGEVGRPESLRRAEQSSLATVRPLDLLGQTLFVRVHSTPAFEATVDNSGPVQTVLLGSGLSVLAAMVLWLLLTQRARATDIAQGLTAELNRLAMVAQRTSNAVVFADRDWRIQWTNEAFERITGYSPAQALGRQPQDILTSPHADPQVQARLREQLQADRPVRERVLNRRRDGSDYWADVEILRLQDSTGRHTGYMSVHSDVTAEVQAQEALRLEKERADNILLGTDVGTWESNLLTGESRWNERWASMMGFSRQEVGSNADVFWQQRLHPDDRTRINNAMSLCLNGRNDHYSVDVRVLRKDGSWMWVLSRAKVMSRTQQGRVEWIGGIHTDITEAKLTEANLRDMEAFLDRAGRIAGVGAWQIDIKTGTIIFSEQTCVIHGLEPGYQPTLDEFMSFYPTHERERVQAAMDLATHEGRAWDMVVEFRNAQGRALWVRLFGEVEFDDSGAVRMVGAFLDVTRDHLAQMEAERSGTLLRGAIDTINEAFVVYDPQDRLVFCNDKYRAMYARSADLMTVGASFESIIRTGAERGQYSQAIGRVDEWVAERMAAHRAGNVSMEQRLDDGRWLKVVERRMHDGHTVGFRVDITEFKRATEVAESARLRLAEEQRRLQSIIEGTNVGTWEWNVQTGEARYNEQYVGMLGYTLAELEPLGYDTWTRLAHPQDLIRSTQLLSAHVQGETDFYEAELRMRHSNGDWIWILARGKVTRWMDDGQALWVSGTHMDINERKKAAQQLAETMATLQNVLDSAINVGIVGTGMDRMITVFNKGAENLLGFSAADMLGTHSPGSFFEPDEIAVYSESLELVLGHMPNAGQVFDHVANSRDPQEWTFVRKDGSRFKASLMISPMLDSAGQPLGHLGIFYDISKQKEYEASLREAMRLAEQSSVAKSQFLANMSHEIRTPMNAILGMLQLLHNTPLSPRQRDYAEKTEGAARSLLGLLNDILDFSKVEAGKMQLDPVPFLLEGLLGDLSVILSANLGAKNLDLLFDVDPAIPRELVGDALRLKQILINLGGNAVKFTEQGEVVIRWRLLAQSPERVRVQVSVSDTGIGIAPENQARIFEAFTQAEANTTRRFGGTGLGLVISTRLIRLMGSELHLQSAVGQGTTFSFELELPLPELGARRLDSTPAPGPGRPVNALLVDDNPRALDNGAAAMQSLGWAVQTAASGEAALEVARQSLTNPESALDVVFVDGQMPGMDGWETLRMLRRLYGERPRPKFIMLSAQNRDALAKRTGREQELLDGLLVKPLTASMFLQGLADAGSRSVAPQGRADEPVPEGPGRLAGMRVLLVEDNPINQQVARELLQGEGARISVADNGQLGVDAVRSAQPPFDAVLMDLQMPVMDGLTAAREIRRDAALAALPIIAMTANAMASDREACLAAGMNDHVGKPFELGDLVLVLQRHTNWQAAQAAQTAQVAAAMPPHVAATTQAPVEVWPASVDVTAALRRMGGNRALLQKTLVSFMADIPQQFERINGALSGQDLAAARREIHALKGLCGTLGLMAQAELAAQAERSAGDAGQVQATTDMVARLHEGIGALWPDLQATAAQLAPPLAAAGAPGPSPAGQRASPEDLARLQELLVALQASDMGAMELHAALRQTLPEGLTQAMEPLDAAMAELEFEQAAAACENLVKVWSG